MAIYHQQGIGDNRGLGCQIRLPYHRLDFGGLPDCSGTMAIPPEGTFEYVVVVPDRYGTVFSCVAQLRKPSAAARWAARLSFGRHAQDTPCARLVGPNPILHVGDAGPTPNPDPRNPATQRSRLTLTAAERQNASVAEASFILDQGVISALRPGDFLHTARTSCGRIGVSAIRSDQLVFAVEAITAVPLGCDFEARLPGDLVNEAKAVFRKRDSAFEFVEYPVEIGVLEQRHIRYRGRMKFGPFEVWVLHGHFGGIPGTDECVSVVRTGACPVVDANSSALFLDTDTLEMVRWTGN